jgi:hypothetical protein
MALVNEFLSGAHRYFPNMITLTLLVVGLFLGKANWVLIGVGGLITVLLVLLAQITLGQLIGGDGGPPGAALLAACSMLPSGGGSYITTPSIWIALTMFYITYVLKNASNVYTTKPTKLSSSSIPVQQRKGLGLISIVATVLLMLMLLLPRLMTGCETIFGVILGIATGIGAGIGWWHVLDACGADYYPDIHGVMIGLRPGSLHTSPVACVPS